MPRTIFPYKGGKGRFAEWIVGHFPPHTCYVEPFGGSAAVLFNKPRSSIEVYNDANGDLTQFFRVFRDRYDELQTRLERTIFSRKLHDEWETDWSEGERPTDELERAAQFFYLRYSKFGGDVNKKSGFRASKTANEARKYHSKVERLDEFGKRFQNVTIEHLDWKDVVDKYDGEETLFYFDPPYVGTEHHYEHRDIAHSELVETLHEVESDWILSYAELPGGLTAYHTVERDATHGVAESGEWSKDTTERLVMNFDPEQMPSFTEANQSALSSYGDV